ncbi:15680_t:CDS:2 [Funneliformis mosseae]|uniref:15680_t:CDS:1 n=1 Tax=Funneliformis mosseae TaxID=27381 RepID=A0A9N9E927_FUNMO|nr:15680_t:CDS:2 [Funneliformis mosseae]
MPATMHYDHFGNIIIYGASGSGFRVFSAGTNSSSARKYLIARYIPIKFVCVEAGKYSPAKLCKLSRSSIFPTSTIILGCNNASLYGGTL